MNIKTRSVVLCYIENHETRPESGKNHTVHIFEKKPDFYENKYLL
jgi:hypothetical protein